MIKTFDISKTVLYNSSYNVNNAAVSLLKDGCEVITKNSYYEITNIQTRLLEEFSCLNLKDKPNLTKIDSIKINVISSLISNKKVIVFINVLTYLESSFKTKIINYLKKQNKILINYTTEIEETLLLDYLVVLNNEQIIMEGYTKDILKEEKILKRLGYNLPFIIELSNGLKYYNLITKTYYDNESLVEDLWK